MKTEKKIKASYTSIATQEVSNGDTKPEPKDKYFLFHLLSFFLGITSLIPLTFVVTANNYYMYKFKNETELQANLQDKNVLQTFFSSWATVFQILPHIVFGPLTSTYGHKLKMKFRLFFSLCVIGSILFLSDILVKIDVSSWQTGFFILTMTKILIINCVQPICMVTSIILLSKFPNHYLKPFLFGQGAAGLITSSLQIISLAIGRDPELAALIYFSFGLLIILFTMSLLYFTKCLPFYRHFIDRSKEDTGRKMYSWVEIKMVGKKMWPAPVVFAIMLITLYVLQPALTALIVSENYGKGNLWNDIYFVPVYTFFLYDLIGLFGRCFGAPLLTISNGIWAIIASLLRLFIFAPLFMLCRAMPRKNLPILFPHDWQYIVIMSVFSFTHGFMHNSVMLSIDRMAPQNKELAFIIFTTSFAIISTIFVPLSLVTVKLL